MNRTIALIFIWLIIINSLPVLDCRAQGISINESGNAPGSSAMLELQPDVNFNTGLLLPRLTTAQRNSIAAPVAGLIIYNTTTSCCDMYNGSIWYSLGCQCSGAAAATVASAATSITSSSFIASWGGVNDATTFYLDVATDAAFTSLVTGYNNLNLGNVTNYTITGLTCTTVYYYRLRAANPCGTSANSNTISLTTSAVPPTAPTAAAVTNVTGSSFTVNWNNTGAAAYYLDISTNAGFTSFISGYNNLNLGTALSYDVTGLSCNSIFYYRVRASSSCGTSSNSNTIIATTGATVPSAPTANAATGITGGSFYANWTSSAGATTYNIDVATDAGFTSMVAGYSNLSVGNITTLNITGLTCGTTYYYRIRAVNGCGASSSSSTVTATLSATIPSAPTASSATNLTTAFFSANWSAVSIATQYYLDVATDAAFTAFVAGYNNLNVGNVTTYSVTGLNCTAVYYYRVRASSSCGTSASSNTISATGNGCSALYSWSYKIPVTITNGGSALTNYQVKITLNTQALISAGKMQSGGEDIRVTDADKCTQLPFWIETGTINTTATTLWVNVPSIAAGTKLIYVYYGNVAAATASNGSTTFNFFDDFSSGTLNAATWSATGAYSIASGKITITTGCVYTNATITSQPGFISEAKVNWIDLANLYAGICIANAQVTAGNNALSNKNAYIMNRSNTAIVTGWTGDGTTASYNIATDQAQFTATAATDYIIGHAVTGTQVIYYKDRVLTNAYTGTWSAAFYLWLGHFTGSASGTSNISDIAIDWVIVRQYAATVPTTANSAEESGCY